MIATFKRNSGMILVDILLAMSLAVLFIAIITTLTLDSRSLFEHAQAREMLLDQYASQAPSFTGMMPYESRENASSSAQAVWYGNDRIETDMSIVATGTAAISSGSQILKFTSVRAYPFSQLSDSAGTSLCNADFSDKRVVGSGLPPSDLPVPIIKTISLPVNQSLPLTDLQVRNGIAYLSTDSATAADPDLLVFDIRDENAPRLLSSINTGPGIASIALAGQRIYAAADSTAAQLHIIRLDSLTSPILEKKYKLPLPYATATAPFADSIFYNKQHVYLGTEKWDGDEFNILDVSNPAAQIKTGGVEIGSKVNSIYVRNGVAYLASADQAQLDAIDVNDPANPKSVGALNPSGWQRQEGQTLNIFEDALGFGRTSGGFNITADHEAFLFPTTSTTTLIGPKSIDNPSGVYGMVIDRSHIFLGIRQTGKEFQIFDRSFSALSSNTYPLPASVQSMTCDGDSIYILGHNAPVIYEVSFN